MVFNVSISLGFAVIFDLLLSYPMIQSFGEAWSSLMICLEKLVGEVLGKEREHQICALGIRDKLSS